MVLVFRTALRFSLQLDRTAQRNPKELSPAVISLSNIISLPRVNSALNHSQTRRREHYAPKTTDNIRQPQRSCLARADWNFWGRTARLKASAPNCRKMDAYWRASNYLSVGQTISWPIRLLKPLAREHIKPRLLGHWGTTPGLNFIYVHLNRVIQDRI